MARRRHNPRTYVRNTLIGAAVGAGINAVLKYWASPPSMYVYSGTDLLAHPAPQLPTPTAVALDTRSRADRAGAAILPGALIGGIAGMAYTGATK